MKNLPLLMTASVSTRGMKCACFTDEERERMYIETLQYYNSLIWEEKQTIIFVDNSGWNLERIEQHVIPKKNVEIEYISLSPDIFDISKGKGYNELLLINKAIEQNDSIKKIGGFVKVTGRYPIYNIQFFLKRMNNYILKRGGDLYIDIKDHKLYDWLHLGWCGHSACVVLFAVRTEFYKDKISERYTELNDYEGRLLEGLMFDIVKNNLKDKRITTRFPREYHPGGLEGSNINAVSFSKSHNSFKGKTKRFIGNFIRIFLPFFKF